MDARLLDVIIGLSGFLVLIVLLAVLPMVMVAGIAYLTAIVIFILFLSGAGYLVNGKICLKEYFYQNSIFRKISIFVSRLVLVEVKEGFFFFSRILDSIFKFLTGFKKETRKRTDLKYGRLPGLQTDDKNY